MEISKRVLLICQKRPNLFPHNYFPGEEARDEERDELNAHDTRRGDCHHFLILNGISFF